VIFFDSVFLPLMERVAPQCPKVEAWVAMVDPKGMPPKTSIPNLANYEEVIEGKRMSTDESQEPEHMLPEHKRHPCHIM
jgi:hypothetical protein